MRFPARRLLPAVIAAAALSAPARAAGPYDDLLKYVSPNTNTLVLVNPKAAYNSPLGKAEKWDERAKTHEHGALGFVPANAELVVISSEVNLTSMARDFQVGLMKLRGSSPDLKALAASEGGTTAELAGRLTALSARDAYFTSITGQEFIAAYPADRQYMARWIRHAQASKAAGLSPFLAKAASAVGDNVFVAAIDLEDSFDPTLIRLGLKSSPAMVNHKGADLGVLSNLIASAQGMSFAANVTDKITGTIRVEFKIDPAPHGRAVRDLFLELIDGYGVWIPGLDKWEVKFADRAMTLSGPLEGPDLQRILSLFAFPGGSSSEANPAGKDEFSPTATRRYFDSVDVILKNLRSMKDKLKTDRDYAKSATWHDTAAAQIDQISRRGVDPIASTAAYESARRLRAISGSLRGVPIDVDGLAKSQYIYGTVSGGYPGGWYHGRRSSYGGGVSDIQTNIPEMQAKMQQVMVEDKKNRSDLWNQIDQLMSDANRKLMDKYKP